MHSFSCYSIHGYRGRSALLRATRWLLIPLALSLGVAPALAAPSAAKGKAISAMCAACHGNEGQAVNSSYPNLAGQNYHYLVTALDRFKSGVRKNATMHGMTSGLSEAQIQDLAAYFASIHRGCSVSTGNAQLPNHG